MSLEFHKCTNYHDYEVIIINDALTAHTEEIARDFLSRNDMNFQIITHEHNRGVSTARNTGMKVAHCEYICFADFDDRLDENFVSLLGDKAEKENADMVLCGYEIYYEAEDKSKNRCIKLRKNLRSPRDYFPAWLKRKIPCNIWSCIYRKKFIDNNNACVP